MKEFQLKSYSLDNKRNNLEYAVDVCKSLKSMFPDAIFTKQLNGLIDEMTDEEIVCNAEVEERLEQLKSTLGKYWEVTCSRDDVVYWQIVIFPYRIIEINQTYWFVKGHINDDYHSGMSDENINYVDCWNKESNITFKEITKEEFVKRVNAHTNDVLNIRLEKMKKYNEAISKQYMYSNEYGK